jgi:excisionase family DNA binding protein
MILLQIILLLYGASILLTGRFGAFQIKPLAGKPARVVGLLLCVPLAIPVSIGGLCAILGPSVPSRLVTVPVDIVILLGTLYAVAAYTERAPRPGAEDLPKVVTPEGAADYVKRPLEEILAQIEQGSLPARRVGDAYRIDRKALLAYDRASNPISDREMLAGVHPIARNIAIAIGVLFALGVIWNIGAWVRSLF